MRWLNGITESIDKFEQTPGDSERQGSLLCCSLWECKDLETTYQMNNNKVRKAIFDMCLLTC